MKKKQVISFVLSFLLLITVFSGCGKQKETQNEGAKVETNGKNIYPISCDDTLTYWMPIHGSLSTAYENYAETPIGLELAKRTGINVEYIHPSGNNKEQFTLMLASESLPDMVSYGWNGYPGGPDMAITEGILLSLTDKLDQFAPNFYKYTQDNPDIAKKCKTDSGNFFTFPFIRSDDWLCCYQGPILRSDWLKKTGLEEPKTIEEFENVMNAFKEYATGAPLILTPDQKGFLMYAYGIDSGFYIDDNGDVKFGPSQPEYKEVLLKLKDWYDNGILDKDFPTADSKYRTSAILNSKVGAFYGAIVGGIGTHLDAKPADVPDFSLMGITQISKNGDEIPEFSYMEDNVNLGVGTGITTNCKNVELAMRFLDYGYTDEGSMLYNFGIEGESYTLVDGEPKFTETLTNNPEGTFSEIAQRYLRASYSGSFIQDERYVKMSLNYPEIQEPAYDKWSKTNTKKHIMPPATLLPEELDDSSNITANINTYVDEMYLKFVTGKESIDNFDEYLEQLEGFGLSKLLEMKQQSVERYNKR